MVLTLMHQFTLSRINVILEDIDLKELVLPLIVLDFSTEVANNNDFIVTRAHIEAWEKEHGTIEPGTFVALAYRLVKTLA